MVDHKILSLAVVSALLLLSIIPACGLTSSVGVRPGDWWEYRVSSNFSSNLSESIDPGAMIEMVPVSYRVAVDSVSGTAVILEIIVGFRNGTQVKKHAAGDLATGTGNLTRPQGIVSFYLFPAGLSKGDWPWGTMTMIPHEQDPGAYLGDYPIPPIPINDTTSRTYAGETREVNTISGTQPEEWGPGWYKAETTMIIVFDKMTGIVCEVFISVTSTQGGWVTTMSSTVELTETNVWGETEIPEIGGISGVMGLLSLIPLILTRQPFAEKRQEFIESNKQSNKSSDHADH